MSIALTHIAFHCEDIAASIAFYRDWCGMTITQNRVDDGVHVAWLAEPGKEHEFIIVLIGGGGPLHAHPDDFSHLGLAVASIQEVDDIAARAKASGNLAWPARELPPPLATFAVFETPMAVS